MRALREARSGGDLREITQAAAPRRPLGLDRNKTRSQPAPRLGPTRSTPHSQKAESRTHWRARTSRRPPRMRIAALDSAAVDTRGLSPSPPRNRPARPITTAQPANPPQSGAFPHPAIRRAPWRRRTGAAVRRAVAGWRRAASRVMPCRARRWRR